MIGVTDFSLVRCEPRPKSSGAKMPRPSLQAAVEKLAIAGEEAGFSIDQMIKLLNAGLSVEALLLLIAWRLEGICEPISTINSLSSWIM